MAIFYHSTNNHNEKTCFREALLNGMASNYGLYMMPREDIPKLADSDIRALETKNYAQIAFRVLYPYITQPTILVSMSQDACEKFLPELAKTGTLLVDEDLVKLKSVKRTIKKFAIPATRFAEELGNRILGNLVMLGFFSAVTEIVSPESFKKAIPGSVPERFLELNLKAFEKGYEFGKLKLTNLKPVVREVEP